MANQEQRVYIGRAIENDPRIEVAECEHCHCQYPLDQLRKFCQSDGGEIEKQKRLTPNLAAILDGFEFLGGGKSIGLRVIDQRKGWGLWGCKVHGNDTASLPEDKQMREYEELITSAGIKFKEGYGWKIYAECERD
jgi:hypothetical protein